MGVVCQICHLPVSNLALRKGKKVGKILEMAV
jgi:hypothetical protein